ARSLRQRLMRTKNIQGGDLTTQLKRCLTTFDITMLGVGHMIGAGIYVLTGAVIKNTSGPAIIGSFFLSGVAALLSALCYAEFGARFPKAGSAYTYVYVGCGELWAFIIGWNIVLEHMLSAAAVARTWSGYVDVLTNGYISNTTISTIGTLAESEWMELREEFATKKGSLIGTYPDIIAVLVIVIGSIFIALGSKAATNFNTFFTTCNLAVISFVVIYGSTFIDFKNWQGLAPDGIHSRFIPYGVDGMLAGAASCFFAFVGFDGLATAGEEAKNPSKSIPHATYISMVIVTTSYILMSAILSLMLPFEQVHPSSAFADAFAFVGSPWAKYVVAAGSLCGITTSLLGALFSLPRCVYSMADDGLIFSWWAKVNVNTQTPLNAVISFSAMSALFALLFDVEALVDFLSIGTLLAYSIVSASLVILRYQPAPISPREPHLMDHGGRLRVRIPGLSPIIDRMEPGDSVLYSLIFMIFCITSFGALISSSFYSTAFGSIFLVMSVIGGIGSLLFIDMHYQNTQELAFKVFLVPYLPAASLLINILMMCHLGVMTWIRLTIWMIIGFAIYLMYGINHSKMEVSRAEKFTKSSTYDSVVIASRLPDSV
ncbi:hypothetical protein PENTCL1PPCAC_6194, partial [Pristionchus entomophagus]